MKIKNTIALVTGANRGLGLDFVESLIKFGASRVYASARDVSSLAPLVKKHEGRVIPLQLDVTRQEHVIDAAATASDVTLLLNNAGVLHQHGVIEANSLAGFEQEMDVNVFGLARMSRAFAPVIEANGGGAITNMLSVASLRNFPPFGTYSASKAAAMSLTDGLRYEVHEKGIEVFGVYAGFIDTGMIGNIDDVKTSPSDIANNTMRGMEAGDINIYADEKAQIAISTLQDDPVVLAKNTWERARSFRANHPYTPGSE